MHIRHLFLFAFLTVGCNASHLTPDSPDSGTPVMGDAFVAPVPDSGFYAWPDSGPVLVDAGSDAMSGNTLRVALDPLTPPGATIPPNSSGVCFARFTFTAGDRPVRFRSITVRHVGIGSYDDIPNVFLVDMVTGIRLSLARSINSSTGETIFNFPVAWGDVPQADIPSHGTVSFGVYGEINAASAGGQHGFELVDASAVTTDGATIEGDFPALGNLFTIGTLDAATLTVHAVSMPDVAFGTYAAVSSFTMAASGDIRIDRLVWWQDVSFPSGTDFLTDLVLYRGDERIGSIVTTLTQISESMGYTYDEFMYSIDIPGGLVISGGDTQTFTVRAQVHRPVSATAVYFCLAFGYPMDAYATDSYLGEPAHVDNQWYADCTTGAPTDTTVYTVHVR